MTDASSRAGRPALAIEIGRAVDPLRVAVDLDEEEHDRAESTRLLYVAATRAADRLVFVGSVESGKRARRGSWLAEAFGRWGYDAEHVPEDGALLCDGAVLHRRIDTVEAVVRPEVVGPGDDASTLGAVRAWEATLLRLASTCRPRPEPARTVVDDERQSDSGSPPASEALALGDLVHRVLERWDRRDERALLALARSAATEVAEAHGVRTARLRDEASDLLDTIVRSGLSRRLAEADILGRELPVLVSDDGGLARAGKIDLLYRDADGAVVVADYKTDRESDPDTLIGRHLDQMSVYADAVHRALALDRPPRVELWLVRHGRVLECVPGRRT